MDRIKRGYAKVWSEDNDWLVSVAIVFTTLAVFGVVMAQLALITLSMNWEVMRAIVVLTVQLPMFYWFMGGNKDD